MPHRKDVSDCGRVEKSNSRSLLLDRGELRSLRNDEGYVSQSERDTLVVRGYLSEEERDNGAAIKKRLRA